MRHLLLVTCCLATLVSAQTPVKSSSATDSARETQWVVYDGGKGPGKGKHIVFVTGDEEYRSEEAMPQLARILAVHHGFKCTVLFAIHKETGEIHPDTNDNIPGLATLATADLMVIFTRFRDLPDEQMKHIVDYTESGRPIIGLRTATHAFNFKKHKTYRKYSFRNKEWKGGFGKNVLGETWVSHHGGHGRQSTSGIIAAGATDHPIVRGIKNGDVWDPTDVYTVRLPMAEGITPILFGRVLAGMKPTDGPAPAQKNRRSGKMVDKNDPMMPVAWIKEYKGEKGKAARVFATTLGCSQALERAGTRRLLVNACFWAIGMEDAIKDSLAVGIVGTFEPTRFGFRRAKKGVRPKDHALDVAAATSRPGKGKKED